MFSLVQGMHTLLQKPGPDAMKDLGIADDSPQTAFYDEIIKAHSDPEVNFRAKFYLRTKIEKIELEKGKSMWRNERERVRERERKGERWGERKGEREGRKEGRKE